MWGIDAQGAPHIYDAIGKQWQPHGEGVDAAAWVGTINYWFAGDEVATDPPGGNAIVLQPIATVFPKLPDSFKLGVNGAANVNGTLILFNGGRYVPADGSAPPTTLTSLTNWPQSRRAGHREFVQQRPPTTRHQRRHADQQREQRPLDAALGLHGQARLGRVEQRR